MAQCFVPKDNEIYNELWGYTPASTVLSGDAVVKGDVFGFWLTSYNTLRPLDQSVVIYRMRQVEAKKRTGTGEAIVAGQNLYYYPATDNVSAVPTGTLGTDYYKCGRAKKNAAASATTVLMEFDGVNYNV